MYIEQIVIAKIDDAGKQAVDVGAVQDRATATEPQRQRHAVWYAVRPVRMQDEVRASPGGLGLQSWVQVPHSLAFPPPPLVWRL